MDKSSLQRDSFGSKFGVIAAAAGSAIGLGNIWKFPYITGVYGGAAFIVVYLICIVLIGFPLMLSEFLIGRKAQKNAIGAFKKLAPNTPWFLTGWIGVAAAFVILSFYGVVAGWCMEYIFKAAANTFAGQSPDQIGGIFGGFISSASKPIFWQIAFMALTAWIVVAGIKDGIEKYSKVLMPMLLVIIIILDIRAITLPGAEDGLAFLFKPDWSKITGEAVLAALGHAFFSLSLGMGTMITYGSYISKKENLGETAIQVTIADTSIALLAGIAIFPAVFAFGIEPNVGPGLVFVTLPNVFQQMPYGHVFGILFFVLLAVAALTSSISILEVVVAYFAEDLKMSRKKATIIAALIITVIGIFCSLSNGPLAEAKLFGLAFMDLLIWCSDNLLLPLGGLFITLFAGWYMKRSSVEEEVKAEGVKAGYFGAFIFLTKFVAPILIALVFLNGIGLL
ncbi:NSS family neurotransmitter:Na+ symporter [Anaerosolibacter carboniphilus]|uniref:Transporter n=1 Tax=Anaerosolibacter carboniphilus TaxID=1417629 RepID=A0A841KSW3_9FIRM|nr:sodium-dependent transporter [Anaerosolibacter carboniphilus]MBB6214002.1 NSS family neurotransmitter:Na+ symporter [Anaerosolibacter carboniphilus]